MFKPYLDQALQPECNAFYLNPLLLGEGSRVDPHIDLCDRTAKQLNLPQPSAFCTCKCRRTCKGES